MKVSKRQKQNAGKELLKGLKEMGRSALTGKSFFCFIFRNDKILLKKADNFWIVPSDDIADGESPEHAAAAKTYEQTGLVVNSLEPLGDVLMAYEKSGENNRHVFVFVSQDFSGELKDERQVSWFEKGALPDELPECYKVLLPIVASRKRFTGELYLDSGHSGIGKVLKYSIKEV